MKRIFDGRHGQDAQYCHFNYQESENSTTTEQSEIDELTVLNNESNEQ
jgi:hypothetical protein